jgi:hypothetical protein
MGLYKRRLDLNIENICIVLSGASTQQIEGVKSYLNISGFDSSCYDLIAIQEQPININNKILDAGLDDV